MLEPLENESPCVSLWSTRRLPSDPQTGPFENMHSNKIRSNWFSSWVCRRLLLTLGTFALALSGPLVLAKDISPSAHPETTITVHGGQRYEIALDELELVAEHVRNAEAVANAKVRLWDGVAVRNHSALGTTVKLSGIADLRQLNDVAADLNKLNPEYKARFVLYPPDVPRTGGVRRLLAGEVELSDIRNAHLFADPAARISGKQARMVARAAMYGDLKPQDKPQEAQDFYALKRAPAGTMAIPAQKYIEAREAMLDMPRYSTATGQSVPSLRVQTQSANPLAAPSLGSWTALGPGNVGGRTRSILIDPTTPNTMYAAGVAGGVWKTTDGGGLWTPLTDSMANLAVSSMAMVPGNSNAIYAGTGEGFFNGDSVRGAGIFKTTDAGATWTQVASTANANFYYVNKIVVSPNNVNRLYAATRKGLYRSLDAGATWTQVIDASTVNGCLDLAIRTDQATDYMLASCGTFAQGTIYRNTDAGASGTWTAVWTDPTTPGMGRTSLAIAPSNQSTIYALAASTATGNYQNGLHAVYRSTDGGATWTAQVRNSNATKLNTVLLSNPVYAFFNACGFGSDQYYNQGWYDNVIAVDPVDANRVWVGGIDLFRSDDGGANWGLASYWWTDKGTNPRYAHADQHAIVFHPAYNGTTNKVMFVGNDGGIHKTSDARASTATGPLAPCTDVAANVVNWTVLNNGYAVTQFYNGAAYPGGTTYFAGAQDNGTLRGSDSTGTNWSTLTGGDGGYVAVNRSNTQVLYSEYTGISIQKSADGGANFAAATTGISDSGGSFINPFTMDGGNSARLWTGGFYLWRTTNDAASWTKASAITPGSGNVSAIAVSPTNGDVVIAGMSDGYILRTSSGLSTTSSTTWANVRPVTGYVSSLAIDPTNANTAYATYSTFGVAHVWKSTDAGATWTSIDGSGVTGIPDVPVHSIVVHPTTPTRLYVGTDVGVFVSRDGGSTWAIEVSGFANVVTEWLTTDTFAGTPYIFAFTHGRGAWRVSANDAPVVVAPAVTTSAASAITTGGATLNGTVTSNGASTTVTFQYGLTTGYGSTVTALQSPLAGSASGASVSAAITGLTCSTLYHYRVVAGNTAGTSNGSDLTFTTSACVVAAPNVVTDAASGVAASSASLNATVTSNWASTSVGFQFGPTVSYGSTVTAIQSPLAGSGTGVAVSAPISGLSCNSTYHYQAYAANSAGTVYGADRTLTTSACAPNAPLAVTGTASAGSNGATLSGTVSSNGLATTVVFEYGQTVNYGNSAVAGQSPLGSSASNVTTTALLGGLGCNKAYHYRVVASNSAGTTYGADKTFSTSTCKDLTPILMLLLD